MNIEKKTRQEIVETVNARVDPIFNKINEVIIGIIVFCGIVYFFCFLYSVYNPSDLHALNEQRSIKLTTLNYAHRECLKTKNITQCDTLISELRKQIDDNYNIEKSIIMDKNNR